MNLFAKSALLIASLALGACTTAPRSEEGKTDVRASSATAVSKSQSTDPSLVPIMKAAKGYAVFPTVGKGAVGVGGAYGRGVLYEGGEFTGYCDLSQVSVGLALGGQSYTEIIVLNTQDAVNRFKNGKLAFGAQATAVAVKAGAGANAKWADGVAVFTLDEAGLMAEAAIGGQSFTFQPK